MENNILQGPKNLEDRILKKEEQIKKQENKVYKVKLQLQNEENKLNVLRNELELMTLK